MTSRVAVEDSQCRAMRLGTKRRRAFAVLPGSVLAFACGGSPSSSVVAAPLGASPRTAAYSEQDGALAR